MPLLTSKSLNHIVKLELKSLSLVCVVMFVELQIFVIAAKVVRPFWTLILMSASVTPSLSIVLPR